MQLIKRAFVLIAAIMGTAHLSHSQVTAGIYSNGILTQIGVGTDPEKKVFGEGRLFAGDYINNFFGIEVLGQYNLKQSDWHNISGGLMLGYSEYLGAIAGIPVLLAVKPIQNHRNFAIVMEATPLYVETLALRGNLGIRYTIGH